MRLSLVEALCLVAVGAAMVELHDSRRFARQGTSLTAALAKAAEPATDAGEGRSTETAIHISGARRP